MTVFHAEAAVRAFQCIYQYLNIETNGVVERVSEQSAGDRDEAALIGSCLFNGAN